jgi:hypothetical protein
MSYTSNLTTSPNSSLGRNRNRVNMLRNDNEPVVFGSECTPLVDALVKCAMSTRSAACGLHHGLRGMSHAANRP